MQDLVLRKWGKSFCFDLASKGPGSRYHVGIETGEEAGGSTGGTNVSSVHLQMLATQLSSKVGPPPVELHVLTTCMNSKLYLSLIQLHSQNRLYSINRPPSFWFQALGITFCNVSQSAMAVPKLILQYLKRRPQRTFESIKTSLFEREQRSKYCQC